MGKGKVAIIRGRPWKREEESGMRKADVPLSHRHGLGGRADQWYSSSQLLVLSTDMNSRHLKTSFVHTLIRHMIIVYFGC